MIKIFFIFFYLIQIITSFNVSNIKVNIISSKNVINFLVAYELRSLDYEKENKIKRNKLQRLINIEHDKSFNEIKNQDKNILTAICSYKREDALDEPVYLVHHQGNFVRIVPLWNFYFSEIMAPFDPEDAVEACQKYNFPDKISNIKKIYTIYRFSQLIQVSRSLQ